jgi:Zn-dependent protease with chaperone function
MPPAAILLASAGALLLAGLMARTLALRHPERPVEPRWFGFAQAIHALSLTAWFGWIVVLPTPAVRGLAGTLMRHAGPLAPGIGGLTFVLPPLVVSIGLSLLLHDVARRLRTSELPWRSVLLQLMWFTVMLAGPALAFGMMAGHVSRGDFRGALVWVLPAVTAVALGSRGWRRALGFLPQAITHGELREAVFGLAARAKVALAQLYVVPMRKSRLANAFAVQNRTVILTDYLLAQLDRSEVDAVLAHEVAHLRLGHPRRLGLTRALSIAIPVTMSMYAAPMPWALAAFVLGLMIFTAISRRYEYAADAGAIALGAAPDALISGLARITRLNHLPGRWARGLAPFLTHPALDARANAIARRAGLAPERVAAALAPPAEPATPYAVPAAVEAGAKVFDSSLKAGRVAALSWTLLLLAALTPAALFSAAALPGAPELPRLAWVPLGAIASLGALWLATDRLAPRTLGGLKERLARRLALPADAERWYVGLSPDANARTYEGFSNWDLGFLALAPGRLEYEGGECRFTLTPAHIEELRVVRGFPSWVPTAVVLLRWRDASGVEGTLRVGLVDVGALRHSLRAAQRLLEALERWRAAGDAAGARDAVSLALPPHTPVTGARPGAGVNFAYVVRLTFVLAFLAALTCAAFGLPFASWRTPGWTDVWGAALMATLVWSAPQVRHRDERVEPASEAQRRAA